MDSVKNKIGRQDPTISFVLPYEKTYGDLAVDLYRLTGREAMPWQEALSYDILAVNASGKWVHTKIGYAVPRRNGKGEILTIREIFGLTIGERILHTAHLTETAHSAYERLVDLLQDIGMKKGRDFTAIKAKGQENIDIIGGGHIEFRTRTDTGGLGEGYDLLVIDEAQEYKTTQETALKYIISASKNPQTILCGTPPTAVSSGTVFKDFREDVLSGEKENAAWFEWSVDVISDVDDRDLWYETNPSLGLTLEERTIADEVGHSEAAVIDFNIQRLGFWSRNSQKSAISRAAWDDIMISSLPAITGKLNVGIKFNKDGLTWALAVSGRTEDQKIFVEVMRRGQMRDGVDGIVEFLSRLGKNANKVVIDGANGQEILRKAMKEERLKEPVFPTVKEVIAANAGFEDGIYQKKICHMHQESLAEVVSGSVHRAIGSAGGYGFQAINALRDICILDAAILACWATENFRQVHQKISC